MREEDDNCAGCEVPSSDSLTDSATVAMTDWETVNGSATPDKCMSVFKPIQMLDATEQAWFSDEKVTP